MKKIIRFANLDDADDILKIYEKFIKETVVTFEIEVPSIESFQNRMKSIMDFYPWLVCEVDGEIAGYAYASKHGERAASVLTYHLSYLLKIQKFY